MKYRQFYKSFFREKELSYVITHGVRLFVCVSVTLKNSLYFYWSIYHLFGKKRKRKYNLIYLKAGANAYLIEINLIETKKIREE